jgi:DNA repair exonuclease SbcCD ATPase subunit
MSDLDPAAAALDAAAEEAGVTREELLRRALVALADSEGIDVADAEEVAAIEARLDELDEEVDEKVTDLRERFVDLYREVESLEAGEVEGPDAASPDRAAADRVDDLDEEVEAVAARLERLDAAVADAPSADRVDDLNDRLDALDARIGELDAVGERLDAFGERLDEVESDLAGISADDLAEIEEKLSRVANAVVRVKRRLDAAERDRADRERLDALSSTANRHGVRTADCEHCGGGVELGLLSAPECPHCGRRFEDLKPNTGFLGTSTLLVADQPAIDGDVGDGDRRDEMNRATDRTNAAASDGGPEGGRR